MRKVKLPGRKPALSLMFSSDGRTLAVSQPGMVSLFDPLVGDIPGRQFDHTHALEPQGVYWRIAAATVDGCFLARWGSHLHRIDPTTHAVSRVEFNSGEVARFAFSQDCTLAIAGVGNCGEQLRLWWVDSRIRLKKTWTTPPAKGTAWPVFGFFPDGQRVAVAGRARLDELGYKMGGNLAVHDLAKGRRLAMRAMPITGPVKVMVLPDSSHVTVLTTASFHVFDANDFAAKPVRVVNPGRKKIEDWALHPIGKRLATAGSDGVVRLWETATWREVNAYQWKVGKLTAVAFSPDGTLCAAAGSHGRVVVWDWDE